MLFFVGLSVGLLVNRYSKKPLLRFPIACWFLGHVFKPYGGICAGGQCGRCGHWMQDGADPRYYWSERFTDTFWTS